MCAVCVSLPPLLAGHFPHEQSQAGCFLPLRSFSSGLGSLSLAVAGGGCAARAPSAGGVLWSVFQELGSGSFGVPRGFFRVCFAGHLGRLPRGSGPARSEAGVVSRIQIQIQMMMLMLLMMIRQLSRNTMK